jgi:pimeloyl-ACP methyl ester carboxylesterase
VLCGTLAAFARRSDGTRADGWAQRFIAQRLIPQMVSPGALPEGLRLAEFSRSQVPSANHRRALDALASFGQQRELGQIRVPTLLIGGEFDRVAAPAALRQMAAATRHARCALR